MVVPKIKEKTHHYNPKSIYDLGMAKIFVLMKICG